MDDGGKGIGRDRPVSTDLGRMIVIHASIIWFIKHMHVLYLILRRKLMADIFIDCTI